MKSLYRFVQVIIVALIVIIGTFPNNDWSFSVGIDPPLKWVFNYLWASGPATGKDIIFPHGPLAFFMYPLADTVLMVTVVTILLKILLVFCIDNLLDRQAAYRWLLTFSFSYMICVFAAFIYLALATIIVLYLNYFIHKRYVFKITAFLLTAFIAFVKSYPGIISLVIFLSFTGFYFFREMNFRRTILDMLSILCLILVFWLALYGTLSGIVTYYYGIFQLAMNNSGASSFYPDNNWWALSVFLLVIFLLPFIKPTGRSLFFGALLALSLFAVWKHAMAREDVFHYGGLIIYIAIVMMLFMLFEPRHGFRNITAGTLAIFLLVINSENTVAYRPRQDQLVRVNNFVDFVTGFTTLQAESRKASEKKISRKILPAAMRDSIGDSTVDIYPWDYSIIPANGLHWQPRVVIQSYAAYTPWLDKKNADHFNSANSPRFIIWDLDKRPDFPAEKPFLSIDGRYLLNDEPQTLVQMMRNYAFCSSGNGFLLVKKRNTRLKATTVSVASSQVTWGQWDPVPKCDPGLLRVKVRIEKSWLQMVKSFLYKDEEFTITLKFSDGLTDHFKFIPDNAANGIWISPLIGNPSGKKEVAGIKFECSRPGIMKKKLSLEWERTIFSKGTEDAVSDFFNGM